MNQKTEPYYLKNKSGGSLEVLNYGGIIRRWWVHDKIGLLRNIVLGYDDIDDYLRDQSYLGALVGRVANRIENGALTMGGNKYELESNHGRHHLHGGDRGFNRRYWKVEQKADNELLLSLTSKHMEGGYPGNLNVKVKYHLAENNSLRIEMEAIADMDSLLNLTQHSYFNLDHPWSTVSDHQFEFSSRHYLKKKDDGIPTGDIIACDEDPLFDFSVKRSIKDIIFNRSIHPSISTSKGYDHHFLANDEGLRHFASINSADSMLELQVYSDAPGFQFYTGNYLLDSTHGAYNDHTGFCIEPQAAPNAINNQFRKEVQLAKGQTFRRVIEYRVL